MRRPSSGAPGVAAAVLATCVVGCDAPVVVDAGAPSSDAFASPDAFVRADGGLDAFAPDGFVEADAFVTPDAFEPDAFVEMDAGFDCAGCAAPGACESLSCVDSCVYTPVADGTSCGAGDVCVGGTCVAPGCGDGIRTGTEACDDGNLEPGDGCDAACEADVRVVASVVPGRISRVLGAVTLPQPLLTVPGVTGLGASGMDDLGNLIVTWSRHIPGTVSPVQYDILLQRFDAHMVPVDAEPVVVATLAAELERHCLGVLPLASGWALVRQAGHPTGAAQYLVVPPTGRVPAEAPVSTDYARSISATRIRSGFVVGWDTNDSTPVLRVRVFDTMGRGPAAFDLQPRAEPRETNVSVSSIGEDDRWTGWWLSGWADPVAYRREHDGAVALGSPVRTYEPYLLMHVSDRRDDWLVQAGLEMTDLNTVQVTAVQDGVTYPDTSHWVSAPRRGTDDQLSVASLGGGEWFAIWRNSGTGLQLLTSAGASPPRGWDRLQAATSSITRSASLGRAGPQVEDGWIFTWVEPESSTGTADELRLIRLMPALPSGG